LVGDNKKYVWLGHAVTSYSLLRPTTVPEVTPAIAAIDIGTNSLHLLVAEIVEGGSFRVLTRERDPIRLGSGAGDMKRLDPEAIDRGLATLRRFVGIASNWDAPISAFATSAVREASNRADFIDRARDEAGVVVEVISGPEEARLIHLGVLQALPLAGTTHLVVDIGGGSTEFIVGRDTTPVLLRSVKLGAIRLTERFFAGGLDSPGAIDDCRRHVSSFLASFREVALGLKPTIAIATSGTAETLAILAGNPEVLLATDLHELTIELLSETPKQRLKRSGLDERRADIIAGGAVLLDEITTQFGVEEWRISDHALRSGIVLDAINRRGDIKTFHHLSDLRRRSALAVARRYREDLDHAEHITDLALQLFDELSGLHRLGVAERDLLETAGLMHNIGVFVAHSAHHKHSYYLISNDEQLAGFTNHERELIAQVARYHRKSAPKQKHRPFAALNHADQNLVRQLAGLLRVAIGLDRGGRQVVRSVSADFDKDTITVRAAVLKDQACDLELHAARERSDLLSQNSERDVTIEADLVDPVHPSRL